MGLTWKEWSYGFGLLALLYGLYMWRPRVGASAAAMILVGVIVWQAKNKKGVFALSA